MFGLCNDFKKVDKRIYGIVPKDLKNQSFIFFLRKKLAGASPALESS
jgi:hypothetical protein